MTSQQIISELEAIEAWAGGLKDKAAGLRRKLDRFNGQASRKRAGISQEEIANVLTGRQKFRTRKALKNL